MLLALALAVGCGEDPGSLRVVGSLERDRVELVAEAQEPIVERLVREGDRVEVGDLVVRLDDTRFRAQLAEAEAARDRAEARLAELVRGPRRERIAEGRARLSGAESLLVEARLELERFRALFAGGVAAQADLDTARARHDDARAQRDVARAALDELLEGTTAEELEQARAAHAEAEAAIAELRVRLARLEVRAPRPGRIDALPYERGERPPPGAPVAVLLVDRAPYARVYVPEPVRVRLQPGEAARVFVDGIEGSFAGRLRVVESEATFTPFFALTERDRSRLSYLAKVDLVEDRAREIPSGVPVEVVFELGRAAAPAPGPPGDAGE